MQARARWVGRHQPRSGPARALKLKPEVVHETPVEEPPPATETATSAFDSGAPGAPINRFDITEVPQANGDVVYTYSLDFPALRVFEQFSSPSIKDRAAYVRRLYSQLETLTKTPGDPQNVEAKLRSWGGDSFVALFPRELRELLWNKREELRDIMVVSTEPFIPWELLHLKPPDGKLPNEALFLAQFGLAVLVLVDSAPGPSARAAQP